MSLKYILGLPDTIEGVGKIYPVKLKDYEEFSKHSSVLHISKGVFVEELQELPLLDLIALGLKDQKVIKSYEVILSLSLRKEVRYFINEHYHGFLIGNGEKAINSMNFDAVRESIMKHDLVFEPKLFKNKIVQEWADKVMAQKAKNAKVTMEEQISIVQAYTGVSYEEISEYTIYQLYASFNRIAKIIAYETTVKFRVAGAKDVTIEDYMEKINLHISPYDNLFVNNDKLGDVNKALQ